MSTNVILGFLIGMATVIACWMYLYHAPRGVDKQRNRMGYWQYKTWELKNPDNSLDILKQKLEDERHYKDYEWQRMVHDRDVLTDEMLLTHKFFETETGKKELSLSIAKEEIDTVREKYELYLKKCKVLEAYPLLSIEQFYIKEQNFIFCGIFDMFLYRPTGSCYTIYHEPTAKYKGSVTEMIQQEFKQKNY